MQKELREEDILKRALIMGITAACGDVAAKLLYFERWKKGIEELRDLGIFINHRPVRTHTDIFGRTMLVRLFDEVSLMR